jgi:hypothetical protein
MNKMKSILSVRKILTMCLAVFILATLTFASFNNKTGADPLALKKAEALSGKAMNCLWYQRTVYYSDAAHTTQIGVIVRFCDGETGNFGTTSQFFVIQTCECIEE